MFNNSGIARDEILPNIGDQVKPPTSNEACCPTPLQDYDAGLVILVQHCGLAHLLNRDGLSVGGYPKLNLWGLVEFGHTLLASSTPEYSNTLRELLFGVASTDNNFGKT